MQNNSNQNSEKIFLMNKVRDCHVGKCPLGTMTNRLA